MPTKDTEPGSIYAALIEAKREFGPVTKSNTANTGKFSYTYADLGSVLDAVTPALNAHGLIVTQSVDYAATPDGVVPMLTTALFHAPSGASITGTAPIICADMRDPQKVGGAITYMRRYALMALLGLNAEDDDAQHARKPRTEPTQRRTTASETHDTDPRGLMPMPQFMETFSLALFSKDARELKALMDGAADSIPHWVAMADLAGNATQLKWVKDEMEKRGISRVPAFDDAYMARTAALREQEG